MRLAYNGRGIYSFISNIIEVSANIRIFFHYDGRNPQKQFPSQMNMGAHEQQKKACCNKHYT